MNKRILITGSAGQMGLSFRKISNDYPSIDFIFLSKSEFDLRKKEEMLNICKKLKPDYIINCAAYTAVDKAEEDAKIADQINNSGAEYLAEISSELDIFLIHFSTDYVYHNGLNRPLKETDPLTPQSEYGKTKLDGEEAIVERTKKFLILRASWIYGEFQSNFLKTMIRLMSQGIDLKVVSDQIGTPSYSLDLAISVMTIIINGQLTEENSGIYNLSNAGNCSWFDFAKAIHDMGSFSGKLDAIPTSEYSTPAERPQYSVMDLSKIHQVFDINMRSWEDALGEAFPLCQSRD